MMFSILIILLIILLLLKLQKKENFESYDLAYCPQATYKPELEENPDEIFEDNVIRRRAPRTRGLTTRL